MGRLAAFPLLALLAVFVTVARAGNLTCTGSFNYKQKFGANENLTLSLTPKGATDKAVILDLAEVTKPANYKSWDDAINSAKLLCTCTEGDCSADYPKVLLRIFAEPYWRKHGGGDSLNMTCAPAADGASCGAALAAMPAGWGSRASAVALLYDLPAYTLPKTAPADGSPSPSASPSPSTSSSPSPSAGATPPPPPPPPSPRPPSPRPPSPPPSPKPPSPSPRVAPSPPKKKIKKKKPPPPPSTR